MTMTKVERCKLYQLLKQSQKVHGLCIDQIKGYNEKGILIYEHPIRSQYLISWDFLGVTFH